MLGMILMKYDRQGLVHGRILRLIYDYLLLSLLRLFLSLKQSELMVVNNLI